VTNSGKPYLRVAESYSAKVGGVRKNRKRTIRNIGPLARYDDGQPDFLKRLKQSFKDGCPIIAGLDDLIASGEAQSSKIKIELDRNSNGMAFSNPKNIGYFFLDAMYDAFGIYDVLNKYKSQSKVEYDLNGLVKSLVFGRALAPDSKCATWKSRDNYLFDVVSSEKLIEAYRALDVLDDQSDKIQRRMNTKIEGRIGRSKSICYYDVTNYWFEIDDPDEDRTTETGKPVEGMRKRGPSKAKNKKPIVQMGLFIDDNGLPISYKVFPGNHIDQTTLRPAMKETIGKMGFDRTIIVADGGLNSGKNLAHIVSNGNGYIVSKSAKGSTQEEKKWILQDGEYVWNETKTFKLKFKVRTRTVKDEDGNVVVLKEKVISYWSKKQYDHAAHENRKFLEYLDEVIKHPDKLKDKQSNLQKYLIKTEADKSTGEVLDSVSILGLDMDKIKEDIALMGYYTIITSELEMDNHEVIDKYHGLSRIEAAFRVIKSDLEGRPVYVRNERHINAHFLICFIALTMIRLIQHKVLSSLGKITNSTRDWEMGIPADRIKTALAEFCADALPGGYYRLTSAGDDLTTIANAFGVDVALRIPTVSDIRKLTLGIDNSFCM
jgi:transposase